MTGTECTKRRYTRKAAQMALLETKMRRSLHGNTRRKEQRVYYHKPCKAWHITSQERADNGLEWQMQEKPGMAEEKEPYSGETIQE